MPPLLKTLRAIESHPHSSCPCAGPIANFVETGDPKSLAKTSAKKCSVYYLRPVIESVSPPDRLDDADHRLLKALATIGLHDLLLGWVSLALREHPRSDEDYHGIARAAYGDDLPRDVVLFETLDNCAMRLLHGGQPTSAGRFLLTMSDAELDAMLDKPTYLSELLQLLLVAAPKRVPPRVERFLHPNSFENGKKKGTYLSEGACEHLVRHDPKKYGKLVAKAFHDLKDSMGRFSLGKRLLRAGAEEYRDETREACASILQMSMYKEKGAGGYDYWRNPPWEEAFTWLLETEGAAAVPALAEFVGHVHNGWFVSKTLEKAVAAVGRDARPVALAAVECGDADPWSKATTQLIEWNDPADEEAIAASIRSSFESSDSSVIVKGMNFAGRWKPARFTEDLWRMLGHTSKPVREAAGRALGAMKDAAVSRAGELLDAKKASLRSAAVVVLRTAGTPEATRLLEARLDEEPDDEVRDQILVSLESVWDAQGRQITRADVAERVRRTKPKLADALPKWLNLSRVPKVHWTDGDPLDDDTLRYLIHRQSRAKEMRADVEAKPLYALIDRSTSGDFALSVLKAFLGSSEKVDAGDRWAMSLACLLGDDRIVPVINSQVREWVDANRGKLAEYAVQALALVGSDAALCVVDGLSIRYRSKQKNIGKAAAEAFVEAAERLGVTPDELGDRVVPWLGFEPGKPRIVEAGKSRIEVRVAPDFKFTFHDLDKNKKVASLPAAAGAEAKAEFKELGATLREVLKGQLLRLENLMVRQFRWPLSRWKELFLEHPILFPFAQRLVWGLYDAEGRLVDCCRALEDRTLTDETDGSVELPNEGGVGIVHPLEMDEEARTAWKTHLADYGVESPFPQMERSVIRPTPEEAGLTTSKALRGTALNALTFKSRAEKLGWQRGSVCDAGSIPSYVKSFPGAGADAFVCMEGMYIGVGMDGQVDLTEHYFVKTGSVRIGSYTYDDPRNESDPRLIRFGDVPPIVYSEVAGDLKKITGGKDEE